MFYTENYDVIVVGGGHAGTEAALAPARMGLKTLLLTHNVDTLGQMSCNPAIGGIGKGHLVKEVDAMGGLMAHAADKAGIQFRTLNSSKGPAVRATRAQADRVLYRQAVRIALENQPNLDIFQQEVTDILIEQDRVCGVETKMGLKFRAKSVILTAGTFLAGKIHIGLEHYEGGRAGDPAAVTLSHRLRDLNLRVDRLKTGTPPRIDARTINFDILAKQHGDAVLPVFSFMGSVSDHPQQIPCYITHTNEQTHEVIRNNLDRSPMYTGVIEGIGPRYCPSIEDKVVKFSDKPQHQIFLEPESKEMNSIYVQGFSTSMPHDIQERMIRTLPGLENCTILKYAYAIEYDAIDPLQLWPSLETKVIKNLFTAGQINGTSGYEEAAGQGLMAGINATLKVRNEAPLVLKRDEAYIGVMIDDLVTKGTKEPYRMLTSRAEYRLLIRHDNADERLYDYSHKIGLVKDKEYQRYQNKMKGIYDEIERLSTIRFTPKDDINEMLEQNNSSHLKEGVSAKELITRPEITYDMMLPYIDAPELSEEQRRRITILIKYAGYIEKAKRQAQKQIKMEEKHIPEDIDYEDVKNLALEAKQKLSEIRPLTIGQASRISGINPADISVLLIYLKQKYNGE